MYEETGGGIVSLLEPAGFIKNRRKGGKQSLRGLAVVLAASFAVDVAMGNH